MAHLNKLFVLLFNIFILFYLTSTIQNFFLLVSNLQ